MKIIYSAKFEREYKKLPDRIKNNAEEQEKIFRQNPFDSRLKTHRLYGKLKDLHSFSIGYKYRLIFEFADQNIVYFHSIGTHNIYQ